jgi:hypothetical protein
MAIVKTIYDLLIPEAGALDTHEHIQIVDGACLKFLGKVISIEIENPSSRAPLRFTLGEVSSLAGDYYETPAEFVQQSVEARKFLAENKEDFKKGDVSQQEAARLTKGKYLDLAIRNYDHFRNADRTPSALASLKRYHDAACNLLLRPARPNRRIDPLSYAYLHAGFALHYAMDAFAAGHIRTPRYALYQYMKDSLNYPDANAEIAASLLCGHHHDQDNINGLYCEYVPCEILRAMGVFLQRNKFFGDNTMNQNSDEVISHMHDVIFCILTHMSALLQVLVIGKRDPSPWRTLKNYALLALHIENKEKNINDNHLEHLEDEFDFDTFLALCLPKPVPEDDPDLKNTPPVLRVEGGSAGRVTWHGDEEFIYHSIFKVKVDTDDDGGISGIQVSVPNLLAGTVRTVIVSGMGIPGLLINSRTTTVIDGREPRLIEVFQRARSLMATLPGSFL